MTARAALHRASVRLCVGASVFLGACAVGPAYRSEPAPLARAGAPSGDSMKAFFDSLAAARAADTGVGVARLRAPHVIPAESLADLTWLDVLRDTALTRLVGTALRQNRDLEVARARIREFRAGAAVAFAALLPGAALNGSDTRTKLALGSLSFPPYTAYRATADASWSLDLFGGARRGLEAANADLAAQQAAERATALAVVSEVAGGYLQLLELDAERATAQQTLVSRRATLDLARRRLGTGLISELDVRQFEAQVAVPAVRLAQVEQAQAAQEHALDVLLGEAPAPIARGTDLAAAARAVAVPDSVPAALIERRPDVVAAEREMAAANARIGVAVAARLPSLTLTGEWGSQALQTGQLFTASTRIYTFAAGISIPIFTGGRNAALERAARARADEAKAAYEQAVLGALEDAGDALAGVKAARDQLAAQETQATALRSALELATRRYESGVSNYLEVLDAQRSLFDAQLAESQAQLGQLLAAVRLYRALGGSWPETPRSR